MLRAHDLEVSVADRGRILGPLTLEIGSGSLVALMGASGSGKSTLLRVLSGVATPTGGAASWSGEATRAMVQELGYVPQRESIHDGLTTREALHYAASLRLDAASAVGTRVAETLHQLDLLEQADTRVGDLSGGERRRAACGLELVGHPPVLLLDEPTSGLDTVLERRLMLMFRRLADQGRAILIATHATASLDLCDQVVFLKDGIIEAQGTPQEARAHLARVAGELERRYGIAPPGAPRRVPGAPRRVPPAAPTASAQVTPTPAPAPARRPFALEVRLLSSRYARTLTRDRRTLALLIGQAPVLGLLIAVIFRSGVLSSDTSAIADIELVFMLMTAAIWLGITSATREVVKERPLVEREFDVGVRLDAYVTAKAGVVFALNLVQVALLTLVALSLQPLGIGLAHVAQLFILAVLTAWASAATGLTISCLARTVDQAAGAIPLLLMPQLLLSGGLVPVAQMPAPVAAISNLVYGRWSFAGMATTARAGDRLTQAGFPGNLGYSPAFFSLTAREAALVLVAFTLAGLIAAVLLLMRRAPL